MPSPITPLPVAPSPALFALKKFGPDLAAFAGGADQVTIKPNPQSATELNVVFHNWGANQAAGTFLQDSVVGAKLLFSTDDPHGMGIPPDSKMAVDYLKRLPGVNGAMTGDGYDVMVFANNDEVANHVRQLVQPKFTSPHGEAKVWVFAQPPAEPA